MRFSRVTRHYIARHLETPGLWDRHPFVLTKVWCFFDMKYTINVSVFAESWTPWLLRAQSWKQGTSERRINNC